MSMNVHLDLLSIQMKNVKTFRWDHRLQRPNLFMALKRAVGLLPDIILTLIDHDFGTYN